jgi:hypothetical protein
VGAAELAKPAEGDLVRVCVEDDELSFEYVEAPPKAKKYDPGAGGEGDEKEVPELVEKNSHLSRRAFRRERQLSHLSILE